MGYLCGCHELTIVYFGNYNDYDLYSLGKVQKLIFVTDKDLYFLQIGSGSTCCVIKSHSYERFTTDE